MKIFVKAINEDGKAAHPVQDMEKFCNKSGVENVISTSVVVNSENPTDHYLMCYVTYIAKSAVH